MALADRLGRPTSRLELVQRALMAVLFGSVGVVLLAVTFGRARVALWTVVVACWLLGGLQLLFPETLVRAGRLGDRTEKSPGDPVAAAEMQGKRIGAVLFALLGVALVVFQDAILGLF